MADWQNRDAAFAMLNWYRASPIVVPPLDAPLGVPGGLPAASAAAHHPDVGDLGDGRSCPARLQRRRTGSPCAEHDGRPVHGCGHFVPWEAPARSMRRWMRFWASQPTQPRHHAAWASPSSAQSSSARPEPRTQLVAEVSRLVSTVTQASGRSAVARAPAASIAAVTARLLVVRHILPDDRMHQHPGGPGFLRPGQFGLDEIGGVHLHQIGRRFAACGDRRVHPLEPHRVFRPDIGLQPQRLLRVGQINRRDIAALGRDNLDRAIRRRRRPAIRA